MPDICIGFEVHQPYRLNRDFTPRRSIRKKDLPGQYFDPINRDILLRVAEKCYTPATRIILSLLDEGFSCAFSLSGTVIEQLEAWSPDTLSLFDHVARHRNAEMLAQTYYHSIAGCFSDKSEFRDQVRQHEHLMHDLFGARPSFFENTEFTFNNGIAALIKEMGFSGSFTEGVDRVLGGRSPNHVYSCRDLPVLLRNTALSDDIAFRFGNRAWNGFPLTPEKYAGWVAGSPGDMVTVFLDYETFGEHFWHETGILDFLQRLPDALAARGVRTLLPSQATEEHPSAGEIDVAETISWADLEKDTSAWMGNDRQRTAFHAVQSAQPYMADKTIWRYLQQSDHFYYMASKYGSCGEVHSYFSHHEADDAFRTYLRVLADLESRSIRTMKNRVAAKALRTVPPERAFQFAGPSGFIGHTAYSLDQFEELLAVVPKDSVSFHMERGDFAGWILGVLGDQKLAGSMEGATTRYDLIRLIRERRLALWSHLQ